MEIRTLSVGLLSLGLSFGAGALVLGHSGPTIRPGIARTSLALTAQPDPNDDADDDNDDAEDHDDDEQVIPFDQAPEPVRAAALKLAIDAKNISQVTREQDDEIMVYEIEYTENGAECSAEFTAAGDLIELEKPADVSKLPPGALAVLNESYPGAKLSNVRVVTKVVYILTLKAEGDDDEHAITVTALGDLEDDSCCDDEDEHDDADHEDVDHADADHGAAHGAGHGEGHDDAKHKAPTPAPAPARGPGTHGDPA